MRIPHACISAILMGVLCVPAASSAADQNVSVGDSRLRVTLTTDGNGVRESGFFVDGAQLPGVIGTPWAIETLDGKVIPKSAVAAKYSKDGRSASFTGETSDLGWKMEYRVTGAGRITKSLTIVPRKDVTIKRVSMWNAGSTSEPLVSRTPMQDIAAFYRDGAHGLFVSLDFPYSKIVTKDSLTTVAYPPYERLKAGQEYACHSLTFGATKLVGHERYGFDEGEVDAVDSYVQERFKPRFNRPMFTSCCMNNRYTQPDKDYIFYTMKDHPTLSFNTDLFKRDLALMRQLGMEYYQIFPGVFDWAPGDPDPKVVKELMDFSRKKGMHTGDYSTASGLFCGHYNEHRNTLNKPEWQIKDAKGNVTGLYSLGVPEYVDYYTKTVVENGKKYGFEIHNLDFLLIQPDYSTDKPYPAGEENVYHQVKGLVRLLDAINGISPNMMTWSNSGNWGDFLPKIAWHNHNLYLTDPFIASTWQGLNMTRLLDDSRREQMVSLHYSRFIPYRFLTNYQYFFSQNSIAPDIRNYQYGALSTLAVTPNLGLGDIRPWLDRQSKTNVDQVEAFYQKWTRFIKKNYALWTKTYHVLENPGMGAAEIYSHASGDHGYVFIVNPQYWDRTVEVKLDASLGFSASGKCEIAELYPTERLRLTSQGPFAEFGTAIPMKVPAQQVLVLEVRPAPAKILEPRVYGIPCTIKAQDAGFQIITSGKQGATERFVALFPEGSQRITSAAVLKDIPKQPNRLYADTPIELLNSGASGALIEMTYRRTPTPTELREWTVRSGSLTDGTSAANWTGGFPDGEKLEFPLFLDTEPKVELPLWDSDAEKLGLGALSNFCGAYIDNALSEAQETFIELKTTGDMKQSSLPMTSMEAMAARHALSPLAKDGAKSWWVQTKFNLPFMYWGGGAEPYFDDHTILALPMIRQSSVKEIKAWMNGVPLDVQAYRYPRNRSLACFYADLVGTGTHGGDNTLVVHYEMK